MADILREQFPGERALGRITLAVTGALESIRAAAEGRGAPMAPLEVAAVASLAAERLDREEADRG
jgi:hypothetical protein